MAMLACARLGAVHSVVFGGFAAAELADPDQRRPAEGDRLGVLRDRGQPGHRVQAAAGPGDRPVRPQAGLLPDRAAAAGDRGAGARAGRRLGRRRVRGRAGGLRAGARPPTRSTCSTRPAPPGKPKGVVRDNGGHAVALHWSMKSVYGVDPGEVWWTASDVGWVVGHSYIVYGPLLAGCTTVLYEGKPVGTPDAGAFWRVIAEHGVRVLFTAPTAFRAIRKEDPTGEHPAKHDLSTLRALFLAGERLDPETYRWACDLLGIPVVDHWWQTETGWPVAANPLGLEPLPAKAGSPTVPVPGWDVRVLDPSGAPVPPGRGRRAGVKLPLPPGALPTSVARRRAVRVVVPVPLPGLLPVRRRRVRRRRRLPVRDGPDGRRDQRRRAPAVDRGDGGGAGRAPGGGRVRGDRRRRRAEGPGAARVRGAQGGRRRDPAVVAEPSWCSGSGRDRRGGVAAPGRRGRRRCRRPGPARSCAGRCGRSPTASSSRCRPRSRTRRCWTRSARP